jgi:hypothetical protein
MAASRVGLPSYSTIDHGTTVRPAATSLLTIDSEDRFKNYPEALAQSGSYSTYNISPYNFTIVKDQSLVATPPTRIAVTEVAFQWTVPNINRKTSQIQLIYGVGGTLTTVTITLTQGFYTPSALAAAMQVAVRALAGNPLPSFTMTFGVLGGSTGSVLPIFEYNTTTVTSVAFAPMPISDIYTPQTKQLFNLLGFNSQNTSQFAGINVDGGITFAQAIRYVDIVSPSLTALQTIRDTTSQTVVRDSLCRVYVANSSDVSNVAANDPKFCPPGCAPFTIYRDFATPKEIFWVPNQPIAGGVQFTVYSDDGSPLDDSSAFSLLGIDYSNWSMTMLLTEN